MNDPRDHRAFERIPVEGQVRVKTKGRISVYALAVNLSLGGLLLGAAPPLPVGSTCEVAITLAHVAGVKDVVARGTVVRSDDHGTAIRFASNLDNSLIEKIRQHPEGWFGARLATAYVNYFKVSQDKNYTGCETFFGVSKSTFRNVILSTFCGCIALATLPVWWFHNAIPALPNLLQIILSFGYGFLWLALVQPLTDLLLFRFLKSRKQKI